MTQRTLPTAPRLPSLRLCLAAFTLATTLTGLVACTQSINSSAVSDQSHQPDSLAESKRGWLALPGIPCQEIEEAVNGYLSILKTSPAGIPPVIATRSLAWLGACYEAQGDHLLAQVNFSFSRLAPSLLGTAEREQNDNPTRPDDIQFLVRGWETFFSKGVSFKAGEIDDSKVDLPKLERRLRIMFDILLRFVRDSSPAQITSQVNSSPLLSATLRVTDDADSPISSVKRNGEIELNSTVLRAMFRASINVSPHTLAAAAANAPSNDQSKDVLGPLWFVLQLETPKALAEFFLAGLDRYEFQKYWQAAMLDSMVMSRIHNSQIGRKPLSEDDYASFVVVSSSAEKAYYGSIAFVLLHELTHLLLRDYALIDRASRMLEGDELCRFRRTVETRSDLHALRFLAGILETDLLRDYLSGLHSDPGDYFDQLTMSILTFFQFGYRFAGFLDPLDENDPLGKTSSCTHSLAIERYMTTAVFLRTYLSSPVEAIRYLRIVESALDEAAAGQLSMNAVPLGGWIHNLSATEKQRYLR